MMFRGARIQQIAGPDSGSADLKFVNVIATSAFRTHGSPLCVSSNFYFISICIFHFHSDESQEEQSGGTEFRKFNSQLSLDFEILTANRSDA
jgi:hypothetical protein